MRQKRGSSHHERKRVQEFKSSKVDSFEDLNVYKQARELTNRIYDVSKNACFSKDYGLIDQIRRASVSIMSNIAEGFERGTNAEFIQLLFIAKGSCGEVRVQLSIAFDQNYIEKNTYESLVDQCRRISGMTNNLIAYLKGARYKGTKHKKPPTKNIADEVNHILQEIKNKQNNNPLTLKPLTLTL